MVKPEQLASGKIDASILEIRQWMGLLALLLHAKWQVATNRGYEVGLARAILELSECLIVHK